MSILKLAGLFHIVDIKHIRQDPNNGHLNCGVFLSDIHMVCYSDAQPGSPFASSDYLKITFGANSFQDGSLFPILLQSPYYLSITQSCLNNSTKILKKSQEYRSGFFGSDAPPLFRLNSWDVTSHGQRKHLCHCNQFFSVSLTF